MSRGRDEDDRTMKVGEWEIAEIPGGKDGAENAVGSPRTRLCCNASTLMVRANNLLLPNLVNLSHYRFTISMLPAFLFIFYCTVAGSKLYISNLPFLCRSIYTLNFKTHSSVINRLVITEVSRFYCFHLP
jgi:hypothetical protein